ncbi:hypothetical protein K7432_004901 [Basidiobolus ranarum]|uniref:Heat shock protein 70 n=1 Tax=Basidiobolus ranarum TaxID=34480 RepID=A0ABR2WXH0_9FUNG
MLKRATADIFSEYIGPTNAKCVAAIDFGTSGTGFAYAFPGTDGITEARSSVFTNGQWSDGKEGKTKTALLLDENNKFIAFGKSAQTKYRAMAMRSQAGGLKIKERYFQYFKMNLYETSISGKMLIPAANGVKVTAKTVFSASLKFIKEVLLAQINKSTQGIIESEIKWILTVPAIWSDAAKQVMRDAAELAGLHGAALQLALEPEAASLWVLQSNDLGMEPGSVYMVCDCGGGTIDVTVHEVEYSQRKVKEAIPANGGNWGSTAIDRRVLQLLEEIFGKQRYNNMTKDPFGYARIAEDIDAAKITFDADTDIVLVLPDSLTSGLDNDGLPTVEAVKRYSKAQDVELHLVGQNLSIPADYFYKTCMEPTINDTMNHVKGVIHKHKDISKVVLVGNFANCRSLQNRFTQDFKEIKIIVPDMPGEAIMKGAVLFGADPGLVTQRKARFTYGSSIGVEFNPAVHPEEKIFYASDGSKHCRDVFDPFVTMNEIVEVGEEIVREYMAVEDNQSNVNIAIYKVNRHEVKFVTDNHVRKAGSFDLECDGKYDRY